MLNNLLNLYRKHSTKTPLEDFTTEVFVGLLKLEDEIKNDFILNFLQLPEDDYELKTQRHYYLPNDNNCIVDFVLQSEKLICFIENKVNSKEGYRQLERYGEVLRIFKLEEYETRLFYCTKYYDEKNFEEHQFDQIRWFQIAKFLKKYSNNTLVNEFLNFLLKNDMAQELTFTAQDFITLENLQNLVSKTNDYMDRVKPIFQKTFSSTIKISEGRTTTQILNHNRLIYYFKDIISNNVGSELKYGFQLENPSIYVAIWVDKKNNGYKDFITEVGKFTDIFLITTKSNGVSIELKKDISEFLNSEKADLEITNWFKESFLKFSDLISRTSNLDWKINVA